MAPRTYWASPVPPIAFSDGPAGTLASLQDISPVPQRNLNLITPELGTILRLKADGQVTSTSATPTLTLGFYIGTVGSIGSATLLVSLAALPVGASTTAWPYQMEWEGEFRALGAAGSLQGQGKMFWPASLTQWGSAVGTANGPLAMPATAAARLVSVNLANVAQVMVGATWTSTTGTPSITCNRVTAELVG
jgi:hypothetical protein